MARRPHRDTAEAELLAQSPRELLVSQLPLIDDLVRRAATRHRLPALDREEFASVVRLRLVERDYAILRQFRRQSSLRTFLTVVIARICLDFLAHQWGKWRPSAEARRLGRTGMRLETLVFRDGVPFDQACSRLTAEDNGLTKGHLTAVIERLPRRQKHRLVDDSHLAMLPSTTPAPDAEIDRADRSRRSRALAAAIAGLAPEDRQLVTLRFVDALTVAEIARRSGTDQAALYRRLSRVLRRLRTGMEQHEVEARVG
jgi:RNA polymerase sigma factor (sigma-70 family)